MDKKVTFQKIADELGVSKGLVSLALRNKYGVSEEMRSKIVLKAIEMGYVFNGFPKRLKNISLLIKNMGVLNEEFWRQCILGIENECAKENIVFNIIGWMNLKNAGDVTIQVLNEKSEGLIILNQCQDSIVKKISQLNIPTVFVDMINPLAISADNVMANNFNAGMQAVYHLLERNHRKIILVGNIEYSFSFLQRYYGCLKAIKRAVREGEKIECHQIVDCEKIHLVDGVYQNDESDLCNDSALEKFLRTNREYTAIVCFNDGILRRLMRVVEKYGIKVPEQLSVVSIDNTEYSVEHGITSVDIPKTELGIQAVRILMDRMENRRSNSVNMELNTTLTERNSVKDLRNEKI